jgi:hypothetical protein
MVRAGDNDGWEPNRRGKPSMEETERRSGVAGAVVPHGMHYTPHYTQQVNALAHFVENSSNESDKRYFSQFTSMPHPDLQITAIL